MTPQPMPPVVETVGAIASLVHAADPALGRTRLVLIDGPAGSGKTTLAALLADSLSSGPPVHVLHADDMYEGWGGLPSLGDILIDRVLSPLARGEDAAFRRWDWYEHRRTATIEVPAQPMLIVEGVGVAMRRSRAFASLVVWVEASPAERLRRGLERDGEHLREEWTRWQRIEQDEFDREGTPRGADVRVDGDRMLGR